MTRLNAVWKSATARPASGSIATTHGPTQFSSASPSATPTSRFSRLPTGTRFAAGSPPGAPSSSGLSAEPRLAPSTRAKAACGGTTPCVANDIVNSTVATLECAAQVIAAAMITSMTGCVATAPIKRRRLGTSS